VLSNFGFIFQSTE